MADRYRNLVGGKWVDAAGGTTFEDVNPANKAEILGLFPRSDHRDIDRAVEAAGAHGADWRRLPTLRRAGILLRAAEALAQGGEEIATLITREMGKVLAESRAEVQAAAHTLAEMATRGGELGNGQAPARKPGRLSALTRMPVGTVAVITPWTFPVALPAIKIGLALLTGNAVVLKPAKDAPLSATRLVELFQAAGVTPGVVNVVHGLGEEAGAPLVRHPDIALAWFAGSREVGREVAIACAADHRGVLLERGEVGAVLVGEDADLELAVEGSAWGALRLSGQRSGATTRLFIHRKVLKEFTDRLVGRLQALRPGDGLQPATDVGPLVNELQLKRVHSQTRLGVKEGAKVLCGGEVFREGDCKRGFFYSPTVLAEATPKMRIVKEEVLGPVLALVGVGSLEEAIGTLNAVRSNVCVHLYVQALGRALRVAESLDVALVSIDPAGEALRFSGPAEWPGTAGSRSWSQALDAITGWKAVAVGPEESGQAPPGTQEQDIRTPRASMGKESG